ncbi:hypothetical protein KY290_025282 [Solanum tuberosum]|uniref:Uncharacterized protein n=1 Tax=Solanum tuberosum TaxID=4113 RepID=A0ABQ7UT40_SOLTU|nr:hypothetical protein KY284_024087 [Solanum tuberosum]KAH0755012.1 hypothetical protein KY290_025282 [Solanum tuberosum]
MSKAKTPVLYQVEGKSVNDNQYRNNGELGGYSSLFNDKRVNHQRNSDIETCYGTVGASLGQRPRTTNVPISDPFFPTRYGPFHNYGAVPSTTLPHGMPFRINPIITTTAPVYTLQQPTVTQRAAQER